MPVKYIAMQTDLVSEYQNGGKDANGHAPVRAISDGGAIPCRHCLKPVSAGEAYLILAHSPFPAKQPYAETGPIFLHANVCERAPESSRPALMHQLPQFSYILRGYRKNNWINYEVAEVVSGDLIGETAQKMLEREDVAYLHLRSSRYNCYQCRIERA